MTAVVRQNYESKFKNVGVTRNKISRHKKLDLSSEICMKKACEDINTKVTSLHGFMVRLYIINLADRCLTR